MEEMTFSTSEQVFFNDLHPNEPVQCSHPQQRDSNVKTFISSASKPRGRVTVAEQRLADQVPERKQLWLVQKTAKRVFHAAIKVWGTSGRTLHCICLKCVLVYVDIELVAYERVSKLHLRRKG